MVQEFAKSERIFGEALKVMILVDFAPLRTFGWRKWGHSIKPLRVLIDAWNTTYYKSKKHQNL